MKITNNYGHVVTCCVCGTEDLEGSESYTPPFGNAIDRVYVGYCSKHKADAKTKVEQKEQARLRLQDQDS